MSAGDGFQVAATRNLLKVNANFRALDTELPESCSQGHGSGIQSRNHRETENVCYVGPKNELIKVWSTVENYFSHTKPPLLPEATITIMSMLCI